MTADEAYDRATKDPLASIVLSALHAQDADTYHGAMGDIGQRALDTIERIKAEGFTILRTKSYRAAQERQRIAECRVEWAERERATCERWARDCLTEERRLRERLTFVYGVAKAYGASDDDLRQAPPS